MPTVTTDATLTTYYEDDYFGDPWLEPEIALLIHGVAESSRAWYGWVPHLARSLRVLRPDLRGFGRSSAPAPDYPWSPAGFAADLDHFLNVLGVEAVHVIGAKLGGTIALQFAATYPARTRSVVMVSGPVRARNTGGRADLSAFPDQIRATGVRGWAERTQRARLGSEASEAQVAWWNDFMAAADPHVCSEVTTMAGGLDISDALGRIKAPTLVVTTEKSALASVEMVREWQQQIANSELLVLPGDSYHIAAAAPDECAQRVLAFIKRRASQGLKSPPSPRASCAPDGAA